MPVEERLSHFIKLVLSYFIARIFFTKQSITPEIVEMGVFVWRKFKFKMKLDEGTLVYVTWLREVSPKI